LQLDKRKKLEEEAAVKAVEAEAHYRSCVDEANERHRNGGDGFLFSSVPDPGSGAFLPTRIRDPGWSNGRIRIRDPG
jgi:hypothetical protein